MGYIPEELKQGEEFSLWESKFGMQVIKEIQAESGLIIFGMQYQNDTDLAKGNIFKPDQFRYYRDYNIDYNTGKVTVKVEIDEKMEEREVSVYMGVDLAISTKTSADFFVIYVVGVDSDRNIFCLDFYKDRISFDKQVNKIIEYGEVKFPMALRIAVESVAYQEAMLQELKRNSSLPIISLRTSTDKVTRATRRSALFEQGKVYLRENMQEFEEMLLLFPEVEHDDLFDAWEFAVTASDKKGGVKVGSRTGFYV